MTEHKYVPGTGNPSAKLLILGDCPSLEETNYGKPFYGQYGRELDKLLNDSNIRRHELWLTNVCKYHIPPNREKKRISFSERCIKHGIDIDKQLEELRIEIDSIKPNCILAFGSTGLWALSGKFKIDKFRGSIMKGMGYKFVPTFHPRDLTPHAGTSEIKGYYNRQIMILDFKRALDESFSPILDLPNRVIQICRNSGDFYEFLQLYKNKTKLAVDIESGGHCLPICVGLAFSKSHSMVVPLWNKDGISDIPDSDLTTLWIMLSKVLWEKDIIGQNFNYDRNKLSRLGFAVKRIYSDVMLKGFTINPELPKGLAFFTSIYTREPFYKDEGMYEGQMIDLLTGCGKDSCVTYEINDEMDKDISELNLTKFFNNFIMKLPDLYLEIENNGFRVNESKRKELIEKYVEWDERLGFEMFKLAGMDVNPTSPLQVHSLLFDVWKLPYREGTGEEELTALLNLKNGVKHNEHRIWIEKCLERRKVRKTISTYLMAISDYDGKMRTTCFMCLETGRTSTGQQNPPIRPLIDIIGKGKKIDMKPMGTAFQVFTKHGDIGSDVRGMYEPDEGEIFVQLDSSQAEARVVFNLATDEQALKDIDEHDYHALTASWFFGGNESDYSKKVLGYESPIRFAGKTLRHAGHLGAQAKRASIELNTQARKYKIPITINQNQAEHALKIFHARQPKIQQVFHHEVIECIKSTRRLVAPLPWGIDAESGGVRTFYERYGDDLLRESLAYIPQRAVTDNTKAAGIRIKSLFPEAKIILEAHDALLFSVRIEYLDDFISLARKEMERPINFKSCSLVRRYLKIPCDVEIGENYKDLKSYKFKSTEVKLPELTTQLTVTEQFLVK